MAVSRLLDPTGRPFESNGHSDPDRLKNTGLPLAQVSTFSGIVGSVSKTYRWAFDEALRTSPQNALAMRRDGTIMALLRERQMPTANSKWHLEPEDPKDKHQMAVTQAMTDIVKAIPRFSKFRLQLLEALWFGRYGNQLAVGKRVINGQTRYAIFNHQPVHGDKFIFRWDGTPGVLISQLYSQKYQSQGLLGITQPYVNRLKSQGAVVLPTDRGLALFLETPQWRERFVVHMHESEDADFTEPELAGGIYGVGLRHRCYWLWWLRNEVLSSLLDYLQRVGAGGLTLIGFEPGNQKSLEAAQSIGEQMEAGNVILVPKPIGTEKLTATVERIEPSLAGSQTLIGIVNDFFDKWLERLFVGQSMSAGADAGNGMGGTGRAQFAANTKDQLVQIDADSLDESMTEQVVQSIKRWNFPMEKFKIYFKTDLANPNPKDTLEAAKTIVDMGGKVVADEILEIAGLSMPEPGDETLGGGQQGGGAPGQPGAAPGESDQAPQEDDPNSHGAFHDALDSGDLFSHEGLGKMKSQMAEGDMVRKYARVQFDESKHKRNKGQFSSTGGSGAAPKPSGKTDMTKGAAMAAKMKGGGQLNPKPNINRSDPLAGAKPLYPEKAAAYDAARRGQQPQQPQKQKLSPPKSAEQATDNIVQMATGKAFVEPQTLGELVDFLIGLPRMVLDSIKTQVEQVKQEFGSWPGRAQAFGDRMEAKNEAAKNPKAAIQAAAKDGSLYTHEGLAKLRQSLGHKPHGDPSSLRWKNTTAGKADQKKFGQMQQANFQREHPGVLQMGKLVRNARYEEPFQYDRQRAPKGGVTIHGKEYRPGEFIPGKVMATATKAELEAVEGKPEKATPKFEVFLIDEKGYRDGKPYIVPHEPGEMAEGLSPGYYWGTPGKHPAGPFNTEQEANEDAEDNDGVLPEPEPEEKPEPEKLPPGIVELKGEDLRSYLDKRREEILGSQSASELSTGTAQPKPDWKTAPRMTMENYWAAEIYIAADNASLGDKDKAEKYAGTARDILAKFSDTALRRFTKNVNRFNFFPTLRALSDSDPQAMMGAPSPTATLGGFYHRKNKTLNLDGGFPPPKHPERVQLDREEEGTMEGIYAHEMTHAVDGPGLTPSEYDADVPINRSPSMDDDWIEAGNEEIIGNPPPLSYYAQTSPAEGFAEFGRLVYQKGRDYAKTKFPKCYAVWEKYDL